MNEWVKKCMPGKFNSVEWINKGMDLDFCAKCFEGLANDGT